MKFLTTPNSKNIIATLRIATIEKYELTFLLILYFHDAIHRFRHELSNCIKHCVFSQDHSVTMLILTLKQLELHHHFGVN